jgi:hypothetical protein
LSAVRDCLLNVFATSSHIRRPGWNVKVTAHLYVVRRLRTSLAIPPFPHTPSQEKRSLSRNEIIYVMVYNPAAQICKRGCRLLKALLLLAFILVHYNAAITKNISKNSVSSLPSGQNGVARVSIVTRLRQL